MITKIHSAMKLSEGDFRIHVEGMIESRNFSQLEMWIENGLAIYTNRVQLEDIWDKEYQNVVDALTA